MLNSQAHRGTTVPFPAFTGERVYMLEFTKAQGLPHELRRWQPTVDAMLSDVRADPNDLIYITLDQKTVQAGRTHRCPGAHVDGNWIAAIQAHGGGGGHIQAGGHKGGKWNAVGRSDVLMLASDFAGCESLEGLVHGHPNEKGGVDHLDLSGLRSVVMAPNVNWFGDALTWIHRPLLMPKPVDRTLVRLNIKRS